MVHVGQRVVGVIEVAEQCGEGEEDHREGDEHRTDTAEQGRVRGRTDTGFVRVEASLDAVDEAGSGHAAEDSLEVEGVFEDDAEHVRDVLHVGDDDDEGDEDIEDAHGRICTKRVRMVK